VVYAQGILEVDAVARKKTPSSKKTQAALEGEFFPADEKRGANRSNLEVRYKNGKRLTVTNKQRSIASVAKAARKTGSLTKFLPDGGSDDFYGMTGKDLGYLAAQVRRKSAEAFLELGRMVHWAYDLWYVPFKKVGRSRKNKIKEQRDAEQNWKEFLEELGYGDFKRFNKQIRQLNAIGKRYDALKTYLDRLPDSQSALYLLVNKADKDKDFAKLAEQCSKDFTAKDIKGLFPKNNSAYEPPLRTNITLAEADEVENALLFAVALHIGKNKPELQTAAWNGLVKMLGKFKDPKRQLSDQSLFKLTKQFIDSSEFKSLIEFYKKVSREKHHQDMAEAKAGYTGYLEMMSKFAKTQRRDFSKLKV